MHALRHRIAALLAVTALGAVGCGGDDARPGSGNGGGGGMGGAATVEATGYAIVVHDADGREQRVGVEELRALPAAEVQTPQSGGKKVQTGPLVTTVLDHAGVTDFEAVEVQSLDGEETFSADELAQDVVLDFNRRGTTKLAGRELPTDRWLRDVTDLVVVP